MTPIFEKIYTDVRVDILHWMGPTALELVSQGGLGYSFDPLVKNAGEPFGDTIKSLVYASHHHACVEAEHVCVEHTRRTHLQRGCIELITRRWWSKVESELGPQAQRRSLIYMLWLRFKLSLNMWLLST